MAEVLLLHHVLMATFFPSSQPNALAGKWQLHREVPITTDTDRLKLCALTTFMLQLSLGFEESGL